MTTSRYSMIQNEHNIAVVRIVLANYLVFRFFLFLSRPRAIWTRQINKYDPYDTIMINGAHTPHSCNLFEITIYYLI